MHCTCETRASIPWVRTTFSWAPEGPTLLESAGEQELRSRPIGPVSRDIFMLMFVFWSCLTLASFSLLKILARFKLIYDSQKRVPYQPKRLLKTIRVSQMHLTFHKWNKGLESKHKSRHIPDPLKVQLWGQDKQDRTDGLTRSLERSGSVRNELQERRSRSERLESEIGGVYQQK